VHAERIDDGSLHLVGGALVQSVTQDIDAGLGGGADQFRDPRDLLAFRLVAAKVEVGKGPRGA
jgi:hypothetical protein